MISSQDHLRADLGGCMRGETVASHALSTFPFESFCVLVFICSHWFIRVGRLSMQGWRRRAIHAILKQKPYNFTTSTLKAYLSTQSSSLSAFMISKTHITAQKLRGRQLNAKVCCSESAIFLILLSFFLVKTTKFNNDISKTVQVLTVI